MIFAAEVYRFLTEFQWDFIIQRNLQSFLNTITALFPETKQNSYSYPILCLYTLRKQSHNSLVTKVECTDSYQIHFYWCLAEEDRLIRVTVFLQRAFLSRYSFITLRSWRGHCTNKLHNYLSEDLRRALFIFLRMICSGLRMSSVMILNSEGDTSSL